MRLLLIEDDAMLGHATREGLADGFAVDWYRTAEEARAAILATRYALILLDISLPDGSGMEILAEIRARKDATPVLMLTARDATQHKVAGLNAGADDYVIKPFDLDELIARCAALIRRAQGRVSPQILWRDLVYEPESRTVLRGGQPVHLSARELAVFDRLITHQGRAVSKEEIENSIYDWSHETGSNTIEVHISSLRRKLGKDFIQTLRGVGYKVPEQ